MTNQTNKSNYTTDQEGIFHCEQELPETQSELWAVWACSLQCSHPINITLKPWRSSHFFTDVVCTSGARGKRQSPVLSLRFCHRNWGLSLQKSIYKGPCFLSPCKGAWSSQELKDSRDSAKAIDFLSASSPHRNDASRANSLPKSVCWQYRHPRGLLLTSFPPHMT